VCVYDVDCRVETHRRTWLLGMLCEHTPATLEVKHDVRLGVLSHSVLTAVLGRQDGLTPLFFAASCRRPSVVVWITDRLPYQVLERANDGACCVCCVLCAANERGWTGETPRESVFGGYTDEQRARVAQAPTSCVWRPLWSIPGGPTFCTLCSVTTSRRRLLRSGWERGTWRT
jgi:hypothetical protein